MKFLIYSDSGVGERSPFECSRTLTRLFPKSVLETISAEQTKSLTWHSITTMFVMPGGRDLPYCEKLNGAGTESIKTFVSNGGRYLGICAGAYFACERVEFECGTKNEVIGNRELKFFSGSAIGSALTPGADSYEREVSAKLARVSTAGNGSIEVYFDGGCFFRGDDPNAEVLSRYLDLPGAPPAAIVCRVGRGKALLSGIHSEFGAAGPDSRRPDLDSTLTANQVQRDSYLLNLIQSLELSSKMREAGDA